VAAGKLMDSKNKIDYKLMLSNFADVANALRDRVRPLGLEVHAAGVPLLSIGATESESSVGYIPTVEGWSVMDWTDDNVSL
jgi:hypothetical protein